MNVIVPLGFRESDPFRSFPERWSANGKVVVSTHCTLSNGDHVTIAVLRDPKRGESYVSDNGIAAEAILSSGSLFTSRMAMRAEALAHKYGFGYRSGEFFASAVPDVELDAAIILMANALQKWVLAETTRERKEARSLDQRLLTALNAFYGADDIAQGRKEPGDSTRIYEMTASVRVGDHPILFKTVTEHSNSLAACHAAFSDIARRPDAPRRVAVIAGMAHWNSADINFIGQAATNILNLDGRPEAALKRILERAA